MTRPAAPARWRLFLSRGTLVTGLLALAAWGLQWSWGAGLALVLLLYVHEAGHVLAALWRRAPVGRAPLFLPGFGAFVLVGPTASAWDDALVALGGPVVGGAVALLARLAGDALAIPALASAGTMGLLLNLANLLPFSPLDGGRVVARTGWPGFVPTLLLGVALLAASLAFGPSWFLCGLVVVGLLLGYRMARRGGGARGAARLGILGLYTLTGLALAAALALTALPRGAPGHPPAAAARRQDGPGQFSQPAGLAVDRQGDLYVADAGNDRIQQLSPTGEPLAQWGSAGAGPGQFAEPAALALDAGGDVYVADTDNGRVQKLSPAGAPLAVWAHRRPSAADPDTYVAPAGVAVGGRGDVYVLDGDDGTIQELAPDGEPVAELGAGRFDQPGAIAVDAAGALYVADSESGQVRRLAPDGTLDAGWRAAARAGDLAGLAADGRGRVYVADDAADAIAVYAPSGAPLARWGAPRPATATPSAATSGWWPAAGGPAWFPDPTGLYEWGIAALVLGGLLDAAAWRFALGESRGARARYLALALGGWPRLLLRDRWLIPANACLAAHVVGLPGLSWLEALVRRLCRRGAAEAGVAAAFGYDCLRGRGRSPEEAGAWLDRLLPALRAGGVETVHRAFGGLHRSGHRRAAHALLARGLADARPAELAPLTANNLAYSLLRIGRPDAALAFARAAAAGAPDSPYPHGTLGATLLALGEPAEAEAALRESLRRRDDPGNRLELARTLAAQSRYVEAMTEAERALREHTGPWREDEAGPEAVESWLAAWRAAAAPAETPA